MTAFFFTILAQTPAAQGTPASGGPLGGLGTVVPFLFIFVIFYFLLIRPQSQRQKAHDKLVKSVQTGDRVITSGGIHGLITNVKDSTVIVKIADNVKIEIDRSAITTVAKREGEKTTPVETKS